MLSTEEDSNKDAGRLSLVWRKTVRHINKGKTGEDTNGA